LFGGLIQTSNENDETDKYEPDEDAEEHILEKEDKRKKKGRKA
jgi:hypothetical protein